MKSFSFLVRVCLLVLAMCQVSMAQSLERAKGWAWSGIAATTLENHSEPAPAPAPKPGDVCQACNGSGKVGDGTIFKKCLDCDGTGKLKAAVKAAAKKTVEAFNAIQGLDPVFCPDGRCDSRPAAAAPKPQKAEVVVAPQACPGGICYPAAQAKYYQAYRPQVVQRRGWIFRR